MILTTARRRRRRLARPRTPQIEGHTIRAIVGIDINYETIGQGNSMLMVATSGTAVVI